MVNLFAETSIIPIETSHIPDTPKGRVAPAAMRAGYAKDAFILAAIAERTGQANRGVSLINDAEDRYARIVASGETIPW